MENKVFLFDFDGTLVDSMPTFVAVTLRILDTHNIPYDSDIVKVITPLGYPGVARHFIKMGVPMTEEALLEKMESSACAEYRFKVQAKNNVIPVLRLLKEQGASLHVLTASPHTMLDACLTRLGMVYLFENIWSCDDFGITKGTPEIYQMAAEKIGVPTEEIVFLDDNLNALQTAKEAGMRVWGVYDPSAADYTDEIKKVAEKYIEDFTDLL